PAGTGKTRLLREMRGLTSERGLRWMEASAAGVGGGGVLALWADVAVTLGLADLSTPSLPGGGAETRGTPGRLNLPATPRDPLEREARRGAMVLALDDLHAADRASLSLLHGVVELTGRMPFLLLAAFRSEATMLADLPARATLALELGPLGPAESATLAQAL